MSRDMPQRYDRILLRAQALTYQNRLRPSAHSQQREGDRAIEFADAEATIFSQDAQIMSENPHHPEGTTHMISGRRFDGDEMRVVVAFNNEYGENCHRIADCHRDVSRGKVMKMGARRVRWATNLPDGTPILIDGVIADVDDETGVVSLGDRARDVIAEVLENDPHPARMEPIPVIDLAEEIHRLIQAKHAAGVPVRSPLPKKHLSAAAHEAAMRQSIDT